MFTGSFGRFAFSASGLSEDVLARRSRPGPLPCWGLPFPQLFGAQWVGVHRLVRPVCVLGVGAVRGCFGARVAPRAAPLVGVTVLPWLALRGSVFAGLLDGFGFRVGGLPFPPAVWRSVGRCSPARSSGLRSGRRGCPRMFRRGGRAPGRSPGGGYRSPRWLALRGSVFAGLLDGFGFRVGGCRFPRLFGAQWVGVHRLVRPVCVLGVGAVRGCFGAAVAPRAAPLVGVTVPPAGWLSAGRSSPDCSTGLGSGWGVAVSPGCLALSGSVFTGSFGRFAFSASGLSEDVLARRSRPGPLPCWGLSFPQLLGAQWVGVHRLVRPGLRFGRRGCPRMFRRGGRAPGRSLGGGYRPPAGWLSAGRSSPDCSTGLGSGWGVAVSPG